MTERNSRLQMSIVGAQPLRVVGLILVLVHISAILGWAWGPRGLLIACVLQATLLASSAPWLPNGRR